jgi:hypothetical protein
MEMGNEPRSSSSRRAALLWPLLLLLPPLMALLDWDRCSSSTTGRHVNATDAGTPAAAAPGGDDRAKSNQTRTDDRRRERNPPGSAPNAPAAPTARRSDPCDGISAYGVCSGDVARACTDGRLVTTDCAARQKRCVMTREGASCLPRRGTGVDCSHEDAPSCAGDTLRHCVDGRWETIDCRMRLSRCDPGGPSAHCAATPALAAGLGSGTAQRAAVETCDGRDNDLDSEIDEEIACDTIALVAFVPNGARLRELEARMQRELEIVNRVFEPMLFEWNRIVRTPFASARFHPDMFHALAGELSRAESSAVGEATPAGSEGLPFYIPVLFVETIATEPPKAGMSTLPNNRCGGVRISDGAAAAHGLVVVSEARQPETLAHEIGHYLGLCHTHDELAAYGLAGQAASECDGSGDGICDTAFDPGPPRCVELATCEPLCQDASAHPDTSNVMSYYMSCRRGLSPEQLAEVERNLSLRRGWSRCLEPVDCPCTPGVPEACPAEMSCQPALADDALGLCMLDGPALPGAPCTYVNDCSASSVCLKTRERAADARCARTCSATAPQCTCTDVGLPFRVCGEDLE